MDRTSGRLKRKNKLSDTWECSVCTFQNPKETFKCMMCDTRKGTSTRKPKQDSALAYQQQIEQSIMREREESEATFKKRRDCLPSDKSSPPSSECNSGISSENKQKRKYKWPPKLKNIDRSSARPITVTYNGVSVVITDYQPLLRGPRSSNETSPTPALKGSKVGLTTPNTRIDSEAVTEAMVAAAAVAADSPPKGGQGGTAEGAPTTGASGESDVKRLSPESGKSNGTSSTIAMSDRDSDSDNEVEVGK